MGWFKRSKKQEDESLEKQEAQNEVPPVQEKSHEMILKEQLEDEIAQLRNDIKIKLETLDTITTKLASVKEEYETVVSNLMSIKKEWNTKKNDIDSFSSKHDEITSKIESLKSQEKEILSILEPLQIEKNEILSKIESLKSEKNDVESEFQNTQTNLINAREGLQKLQSQTEQKKSEVGMVDKEVKFIENKLSTVGKNVDTKNIVEAASAIVASTNQKLHMAEKELEIIKKLLDKERKEHREAKNQLEKLRKSTTGKKN